MALALLILGAPVAWAAAPTISSFTPTSGPIGTSVTITGTGFQDASVVNDVEFNNTNATFTVNSDTQITATVPMGATDGPIEVTDSEGTATSASNFSVETPVERHRSHVTLRLSGHLVLRGVVTIPDGTDDCLGRRVVKVQRRSAGNWRRVGADGTKPDGSYRMSLLDQEGKYRAVVKRRDISSTNDICNQDISRPRTHRHPEG
jgi:hypothetical protein